VINGNYTRHLKVLGKLAYLYQTAATDQGELETLASVIMDQIADGTSASWPAVQLLTPYSTTIGAAITSGAGALQTIASNMATAYCTSSDFLGDLDNQPANQFVMADCLDALALEMADDSKTFTTVSATGLVAFFNTFGPAESFPQSGSPTYADSAYVNDDLV
jgi:hypothetical protein